MLIRSSLTVTVSGVPVCHRAHWSIRARLTTRVLETPSWGECPDGHTSIALRMRYPLKGVNMLNARQRLLDDLCETHIIWIIAALGTRLCISWYASAYVNRM